MLTVFKYFPVIHESVAFLTIYFCGAKTTQHTLVELGGPEAAAPFTVSSEGLPLPALPTLQLRVYKTACQEGAFFFLFFFFPPSAK